MQDVFLLLSPILPPIFLQQSSASCLPSPISCPISNLSPAIFCKLSFFSYLPPAIFFKMYSFSYLLSYLQSSSSNLLQAVFLLLRCLCCLQRAHTVRHLLWQVFSDISRHFLTTPFMCWQLLTFQDSSWYVMITPNNSRKILTYTDIFWHLLKSPEIFWHLLTTYDISCQLLIFPDIFWQLLAYPYSPESCSRFMAVFCPLRARVTQRKAR